MLSIRKLIIWGSIWKPWITQEEETACIIIKLLVFRHSEMHVRIQDVGLSSLISHLRTTNKYDWVPTGKKNQIFNKPATSHDGAKHGASHAVLTLLPSVFIYWYKLLPFDLLSWTMLCDAHWVFKSHMFYMAQKVLLYP